MNKITAWKDKVQELQLGRHAAIIVGGALVVAAFQLISGTQVQPNFTPSNISDIESAVARVAGIDEGDEQYFGRKTTIYDNYNRCQGKLGHKIQGANDFGGNEEADQEKLHEYRQVGSKFIMAEYNSTDEIDAAVAFVEAARYNNLRPIIRLGTETGSDFTVTEAFATFLDDLSDKTGDAKFIATTAVDFQVGKQASAVSSGGKFTADQTKAVVTRLADDEDITFATPLLHENRRCGPTEEFGCLNITEEFSVFAERIFYSASAISSGASDAETFEFKPEWIDIWLVEWDNYDEDFKFAEVTREDETAADQEESSNADRRAFNIFDSYLADDIQRGMEQKGMFQRVIVAGYGPGAGTVPQDLSNVDLPIIQERLLYDYGLLSDDPRIEGIIVDEEMDNIFPDFQDYSRFALEETNCNYDLVNLVGDEYYADRAAAPVCDSEPVGKSAENATARTRVVCIDTGPGGLCQASVRFTVKVGLPIRHCGGNSPYGTPARPYATPSVIASMRNGVPLDYFNQTAGPITNANYSPSSIFETDTYTIPWLNNCIASHYPDYQDTAPLQSQWQLFSNLTIDTLNYGLTTPNTKAETFKESNLFQFGNAFTPRVFVEAEDANNPDATHNNVPRPTLDEFYYYWGRDIGISKEFTDISATAGEYPEFNLQDYSVNRNLVNVNNQCDGNVTSVVRDPQNMIYGSEMIVKEEVVFQKGANQLAYEQYVNEVQTGDRLFTNKQVWELGESSNDPTVCPCVYGRDLNADGEIQEFEKVRSAIGNRTAIGNLCSIPVEASPQSLINSGNCIKYRTGEGVDSLDTYEESDFFVEAEFPQMPEYEIEGAYDALTAVYNRVQSKLSSMNLKLIVNANRGWEADVSMKAYHLPNQNKPRAIDGSRENLMLESYDFGNVNVSRAYTPRGLVTERGSVRGAASDLSISNSGSGNSCRVGVNFATTSVIDDAIQEAADFGYGYGQVVTDAQDVQRDAQQIDAMCNKGMVPILRYCVGEGLDCKFDNYSDFSGAEAQGRNLGNYYLDVYNSATSCQAQDLDVYFNCGHNEAISEVAADYPNNADGNRDAGMRAEGFFSGGCMDAAADNKPEQVKLTTQIFNATIGDSGGAGTWTRFERNFDNYVSGYNSSGRNMQSDFEDEKLACMALNTYSNIAIPGDIGDVSGNGVPGDVGDHYLRVINKMEAEFGTAFPTCVMEMGWGNTGSPEEQQDQAEQVVEDLTATAGDEMLYYLYYNPTGTGGPNWANFVLNDELNAKIGQCEVEAQSTDGDYEIPGAHFRDYNMYLTEGDNFVRENQYYEYLEYIDYLHFLDTVLLTEDTVPVVRQNLNTADVKDFFSSELAANMAGLVMCSELDDLPQEVRENINCLTFHTENSASPLYQQDPLGEFLCEKGYPLATNDCDNICLVTTLDQEALADEAEVDILSGGGAAVSGGIENFIATRNYTNSGKVRIDDAAKEYGMEIATNANYMARALGEQSAEWLWAGDGDLGITPPDPNEWRFLTTSLVKHDGSLAGVDSVGGLPVLSSSQNIALLDIRPIANPDNYTDQARAIAEQALRGRVSVAVSGAPPLIVDGVPISDSQINQFYSSGDLLLQAPRTIIGFTGDEVTIAVVPQADVFAMRDYAQDLGLQNAIGLDGGASSQMYFESGVPQGLESHPNNVVPENVFWPSRPGATEIGPRLRDFYIGFTESSNTSTTESVDISDYTGSACPTPECPLALANGINGVAYPSCNQNIQVTGTGATNPDACDYYQKQQQFFPDPENSIVSLADASREDKQERGEEIVDGFLGINNATIFVHENAVEYFLQAERAFNEAYGQDRENGVYYLPSHPNGYKFVFGRSYSPNASLGTDSNGNPIPSNHSLGVAIDLNPNTNWGNFRPPEQCTVDIPPELVETFEANGLRWGGRYRAADFSGEGGIFDPMHFEVVPDCTDLLDNPEPIDPLPPGQEVNEDSQCVFPDDLEERERATASDILEYFNCGSESESEAQNGSYNSALDLAAAAAEIVGTDQGVVGAVLEVEYYGTTSPSTADNFLNVLNINNLYSGNPHEYAPNVNGILCVGPGQFCPEPSTGGYWTIDEYFAKDGPNYSEVLDCAEQLGVAVNEVGKNICPANLGNAACGIAVFAKNKGVNQVSDRDTRFSFTRSYYGSCTSSRSAEAYCSLVAGDLPGRGYNKYN